MSKLIVLLIVLLNLEKECLAKNLPSTRAKVGQFPWLIQFQTIAPCGGILLSPDWVLTAAQCVQYKRNSITLFAAGLNGTGSTQTMGVKATYIFPRYQAYSTHHDYEHNIALIKLLKPFDMCDDGVQLLEVASLNLDDRYKTCLIFGWQSYVAPSTKVLAKPIQYSPVLLNAWKFCTYMLKENTSYSNAFCAMIKSEDGIKACAGNPGSPVICQDKYQRMIVLGIASWSNFSLDCDGLPTYLGVSVFRSWIYGIIFSDRKTQQLNNEGSKSISASICGRDRYLGIITSAATKTWNYSDSLESEFNNKLKESKEEEKRNRVNNYSGLRDQDNKLKQYHEIGQGGDTLGGMEDVVIAFPSRKSKSFYYGQRNSKKIKSAAANDDDEDELEFMVPLDDDYFIGSSNSLHFSLREKTSFLHLTFVVVFLSHILINDILIRF